MSEKETLCASCLYGAQPYGYYPFVCVAGKRSKEYYHDVYKCKRYVKAQESEGPSKMAPWQVIKGGNYGKKI